MKQQNKSKLTLTCNPSIVAEAKKYVNLEEQSLSSVVEDFLATYISVKKNKEAGNYQFHSPEIDKLSGIFNLGKHRNYKKEFKS